MPAHQYQARHMLALLYFSHLIYLEKNSQVSCLSEIRNLSSQFHANQLSYNMKLLSYKFNKHIYMF